MRMQKNRPLFWGWIMESKTFFECMTLMQSVFGKIPEDKYNAYHKILMSIPDDAFVTACQELIKSYKPTSSATFPLPSSFFEYCGESKELKAERSIKQIVMAVSKYGAYRSVDFNDSAIHETINRFGGWPVICGWTKEDWNINEGRVKSVLVAAYQYGSEGCGRVVGIAERTNGYLRDADMVLLNGAEKPKQIEFKDTKQVEAAASQAHEIFQRLINKTKME